MTSALAAGTHGLATDCSGARPEGVDGVIGHTELLLLSSELARQEPGVGALVHVGLRTRIGDGDRRSVRAGIRVLGRSVKARHGLVTLGVSGAVQSETRS